jgi:putative ABC transport system ATP-binding protein
VPPSDAAIRCRGVVQIYHAASGDVHALRGIDADFMPGSVTAVVGPSGSGKTTLMRILSLMERPTGGDVTITGVETQSASAGEIRHLRRSVLAIVGQRATHNLYPHLTVAEHVLLGARQRDADVAAVDAAIDAVRLDARRDARPGSLSGGEQQRLAVAMATVGDPRVVLADEPTAELDPATAIEVITLLRASAAGGAAVVVNTHDHAVAEAADRVLALHHGTLHSERREGTATVAVIDSVGRVQLPNDFLAAFPELRAEIRYEDGRVILTPPGLGDDS